MLAHQSQREIIQLLVQLDSNELWAVPPILSHRHAGPSCWLNGSAALSIQQRPLSAAGGKVGEKSRDMLHTSDVLPQHAAE